MPGSISPLHLAIFLAVALVWGLNFAVAKIGLTHLPPLLFMALRFALVAIVLIPFVKPPKGRWRQVMAIAFTLGLLHFSLMFNGLKDLDAATAAIAIQLQVPFAALLAAVFFKDKLGWRRALGMAIAFVGVALIAGEPRLDGQYLSLFMVIAAACTWSVANVQIKFLEGVDGFALNAWMAVFATPMLLAASLVFEDNQIETVGQIPWPATFAVLYQSIMVVVFGYGCWYWLLRRYSFNQAMPFTLLVPVIGVFAGVFFLGEALTPYLIAGGCLTVVGVAIIVLRRPKTASPGAERQ
ncbi:DMT family transporter [Denitrobaculum tricleocarpae]|uniref:EamA family transporter n=1 Tax=Denitrobaculum tricleocarpae TaxID=2591009 RepID=A0A545T0W3_9PROT|nr:EamA family transporter [Denitrobaculum tricleocarpae]TQV70840.1 EamA family transporter [Denitrobaculum tricleocarpae]